MAHFTDDMDLAEAKALLKEMLEDGATCPTCGQHAQIYRRKLNETMVKALSVLHRVTGGDTDAWVHGPTVLKDEAAASRELGKLAYFELVEEQNALREDGNRTGNWRITDRGVAFLRGTAKVWKYARVYNGRVLGYDETVAVDINEVAPRFRLDELMAGV